MRARAWQRVLAVPVSLALLLGPGSTNVLAASLSWAQNVTGYAAIAGNWSPPQVPAAADILNFDIPGSYVVIYDSSVPTTSSHRYRRGVVYALATPGHQMTSSWSVGESSGDVAEAKLIGGTFNTGALTVGNAAGSTGTLWVDDDTQVLTAPGTDVTAGVSGTGTLYVISGGIVEAGDDVVAGSSLGSQGTLFVSGVNPATLQPSTLTTSGASGDLIVGIAGTGFLKVQDGAQAIATQSLRVAEEPTSQGTVTIDGIGQDSVSLLTVASTLSISSNTSLGAAGTGSFSVQNGARAFITGETKVGDAQGGTGTLSLWPNSLLSTAGLVFDDAHGVLDWHGGELRITSGVFHPPGSTLRVDDNILSTLRMQNASTLTLDAGAPDAYSLEVGDGQEGNFLLETGAHLTNVQGNIVIADSAGSNGLVELDGSSRIEGAGSISVGASGFGQLQVADGSILSMDHMYVGENPTGSGFVVVQGAGTQVTLQTLDIGGHESAPGGGAQVSVGAGGQLTLLAGPPVTLRIHGSRTLNINAGGIVTAPGSTKHAGRITMGGGDLRAALLEFQPAARLTGYGTVAGSVAAYQNNNLIRAEDGSLVLGDASSPIGFENQGTLQSEAQHITLFDSNGSTLGNVILNSGTLTLPSAGGTVQSGKMIRGTGAVNGALRVSGTISPGLTPGSDQLEVNGSYIQDATALAVLDIGDGAAGDRITVNGPATLAGTLDVKLLPGEAPDPGTDFTLMTYTSHTGTFSTVTFDGNPVNAQFSLQYNPTSLVLHVNQIVDAPLNEVPLSFTARSGADPYFELALPDASEVSIRLYDAMGREVATVFEGSLPAGRSRHELTSPRAGVYFGRATVRRSNTAQRLSAKMVVVR